MAQYELKKNPFPGKEPGDEELLFPRLVKRGTVSTGKLAELISGSTTFTPGEVAGVLRTLAEQMAWCMRDGRSVKLDGIGYFYPTLTGKAVKRKTEINALDIRFGRVNFRAAKSFRHMLNSGSVKRSRTPTRRSREGISEDRKKELIRQHLKEYSQITRTEYSILTGILKNKALRDLHRWVGEGFLRSKGKLNTLCFVKGEHFGVEDGRQK